MKIIAALAFLVCFILVAGCASNISDGNTVTGEISKSSENTGKVALVMKALSNPFFEKMAEGAKKYAENHGIQLEVFGIERENDVDRQIAIVEDLISRKYAAIVIAPADSTKLEPVCKKALEAGIVVINIDNPLDEDLLKKDNIEIPFVGSNNTDGAKIVADYLKAKMGGKGNVLILEGVIGAKNAEGRKEGFNTITENSEIKILESSSANWATDEAFVLTTKLLDKYDSVDAILAANDNMALGVIQALELKGLKGKILVGSYDNLEEARNEIRAGNMHATIEQHPELMGAYGLELAMMALKGEKVPLNRQTPLDLITTENIEAMENIADVAKIQ
jgi:ribose transport system substrate-binding protein